MRLRRFTAITAVLALAAMLGIGGGTAAAKPLSAKEFRQLANAVCQKTNQDLAELGDQHFGDLPRDKPPPLRELEAFVTDAKPVIKERINAIGALPPPKSLKKRVKKFLATIRRELAAVVDDPSIILESDAFADSIALAKKLSLEACAAG